MSWIHEMRRAVVADVIRIHARRKLENHEAGFAESFQIWERALAGERIALCLLDQGHSAHRAITAGRAVIDGKDWANKSRPTGGRPGGANPPKGASKRG